MKWFKHDADASIDAKLQELLLDYGASGYGLYWYCVELIAQNVTESNITFELEHDARIIARNLNLTIKETQDMMKKMIELGLFSFSINNKLACYALAKRLDQSMTSNTNMRNIIKDIKQNHDSIMTQSAVGHDKVMQEEKRIEEIRIEENRVDKINIVAEVIDYLNQKTGSSYKATTPKTIKLIKYRQKEGFTLEDFKTVIDKKVLLWGKDIKMSSYLRPETLFGTKFESYLNEIVSNAKVMANQGLVSEKTAKTMGAIDGFLGADND